MSTAFQIGHHGAAHPPVTRVPGTWIEGPIPDPVPLADGPAEVGHEKGRSDHQDHCGPDPCGAVHSVMNLSITCWVTPLLLNPPSWKRFCMVTYRVRSLKSVRQ